MNVQSKTNKQETTLQCNVTLQPTSAKLPKKKVPQPEALFHRFRSCKNFFYQSSVMGCGLAASLSCGVNAASPPPFPFEKEAVLNDNGF